jgi:hypothetical protein
MQLRRTAKLCTLRRVADAAPWLQRSRSDQSDAISKARFGIDPGMVLLSGYPVSNSNADMNWEYQALK